MIKVARKEALEPVVCRRISFTRMCWRAPRRAPRAPRAAPPPRIARQRVRVARDDEHGEEEQLERNERNRQVVADTVASLECTLHASDAKSAWQHVRLVGWKLFHLRALDVLDTPLSAAPLSRR